jgi:hypothetical protein
LLAVHSQIDQLSKRVGDMRTMQEQHRLQGRREFEMLNANIRRVAIRPATTAVRRENNNQEEAAEAAVERRETPYASTLSPNPRTLYTLWEEYINGIGGRKAACLFTSTERRGRVKHKYHRRKIAWDSISTLVRAGCTGQVAIDHMYAIYGADTPVTTIINKLKQD